MSSMRERAAALAARELKVFPVQPGAKKPPLLAGWPTRASSDPAAIEGWWAAMPDANIGVSCEGMLVLDVDPKNGGLESLELLEDIYGLPPTLTAYTPSGGKHLYYLLPEGHSGVSNSVGALGPGIDVRSTGGYVVAPGSRTAAGEYTFEHPDTAIAAAPAKLVAKMGTITKKPPSTAPVDDGPPSALDAARAWLQAQQPAVEGQGGDAHTFNVACGLRDRGASPEQALELLTGWNETCVPPWAPADLEAKVRNAYKYGKNEPGAKVALLSDFAPAAPAPAPAAAPRKALRLAELVKDKTRRRPYLIKGVLGKASHALMYGAPGEGKSFLALDIGYHVAAGEPWMGQKVRQGAVAYVAFEGYGGLRPRAAALMQHYGQDKDVPLFIIEGAGNLRESDGRRALAEAIAATGETPALIIIDTLAHAIRGGDENSAQDMGALTATVNDLIRATGACVMLIHHSGKNKAAGARGSSALLGAIDTEISVDEKQIRISKQRDGAQAEPMGFRLQELLIGMDEDGDDETSCVVIPDDAPAAEADKPRLTGNARHGFDALCDLAPDNAPVDMSEWRDACAQSFLAGSSKVSQRFYDLVRTLRAKGYVTVERNQARRRLE